MPTASPHRHEEKVAHNRPLLRRVLDPFSKRPVVDNFKRGSRSIAAVRTRLRPQIWRKRQKSSSLQNYQSSIKLRGSIGEQTLNVGSDMCHFWRGKRRSDFVRRNGRSPVKGACNQFRCALRGGRHAPANGLSQSRSPPYSTTSGFTTFQSGEYPLRVKAEGKSVCRTKDWWGGPSITACDIDPTVRA